MNFFRKSERLLLRHTHRKNKPPEPHLSAGGSCYYLFLHGQRRAHEITEQRMRGVRPGFKLGMKLRSNEPRMVFDLDNFHQAVIGERPGDDHTRPRKQFSESVVELEAVAMTLVYIRYAVSRIGMRSFPQLARVRSKTHRASFFHNVHLRIHQGNDWVRRLRIKFGAVRVGKRTDVAGELDDGTLHSQAKAEKRNLILPSILNRSDFPFNTSVAEASRHQNSLAAGKNVGQFRIR